MKKMHLKPPYILVGHSVGGLYMQLFAREYPHEVSGVVLVDSVSPNQNINDPLPSKKVYYYLDALGIPESKNEVKNAAKFPNIPLIVLSATIHGKPNSPYNSRVDKLLWAKWQAKLADMSNKSQHITANKTDHYIQKQKPWLVIAAINHVIKKTN
ncbi:MAG: alpha/beta fold hydrolase [Gammaproteobacteria bacterium]|nr:alpha/beta fold hydrolase [Gammaproteobacteria bacterium]